ncbi:alkaline phosphatase family protein, partial [Halobium palmae]
DIETAARRLVERELDALVLSKAEAIDRELWGPGEYGEAFRERCGDLLVVPRDRGVWYERGHLGLVGMHGGLTREEMLVPFATARLSELR